MGLELHGLVLQMQTELFVCLAVQLMRTTPAATQHKPVWNVSLAVSWAFLIKPDSGATFLLQRNYIITNHWVPFPNGVIAEWQLEEMLPASWFIGKVVCLNEN